MTGETRALPIWGTITTEDMAALKQAKAALDVDFLIVPTQAIPGGPSRIIALREPPPFLADFALIRDTSNPLATKAALSWALSVTVEDTRASLILNQMQAVFGPETKEIPYDPDDERNRGPEDRRDQSRVAFR